MPTTTRTGDDWLPDEVWLLAMLRYHDKHTIAECAAALDRTERSVKRRLTLMRRGLARAVSRVTGRGV